MQLKFTLQFHQVASPLINIRSLEFQYLIKRLSLETALCNSEIDECRTAANIRRKGCRRISCRQIDLECRRKIDLLFAKLDKHTATCLLVLFVQDMVQDRI